MFNQRNIFLCDLSLVSLAIDLTDLTNSTTISLELDIIENYFIRRRNHRSSRKFLSLEGTYITQLPEHQPVPSRYMYDLCMQHFKMRLSAPVSMCLFWGSPQQHKEGYKRVDSPGLHPCAS